MADIRIIQVGQTRFQLINAMGDLDSLGDEQGFVLGKRAPVIDQYERHFHGEHVANIFEIGIKRGGSTAFFFETFTPDKLATIDIGEPAPALERWIDARGLRDRVRSFYGVDQADVARLDRICADVFGDEPLDLVLDDASHLHEETRVAFNALFPRLRPGGAYVIEDWIVLECFRGWEGLLPPQFLNTTPMSDLIKDIVLASGVSPKAVREVVTSDAFVLVRRGDGELPKDFDIRNFV